MPNIIGDIVFGHTMPFVVTAGAVSTFLLYHLYSSRHKNDLLNAFPTPGSSYPYIGHLLDYKRFSGPGLKKLHDELGPIFRVQMGQQLWIVISDPKILHQLLVTNGVIASSRPVQEFTAHQYSHNERGIVFQKANARWKQLRAAAAAYAMSAKAVSKNISILQNDASTLASDLIQACNFNHNTESAVCKGSDAISTTDTLSSIDPLRILKKTSLSYILQTCFGTKIDSVDEAFLQQAFEFTEQTLRLAGTHNDFEGFLPILSYLKTIPGYSNKKNKNKEYLVLAESFRRKLLDLAINSEQYSMFKKLYNEQKELGLEEVDLLVASGDIVVGATQAVTVVIVWIFAILLHYPDVHLKLCNEVDIFIKEHNRLPLFSERSQFPYLNSVVRESMRYRGTNFTTLPHILEKDVQCQGYVFPKGVLILPSAYTMHRDPHRYPDPDMFYPERFLEETRTMAAAAAGKIDERDHFMYGWGRRICPGILLAETQIFMYLTSVIARCDLKPPADGSLPDFDEIRDGGVVAMPPPFEVRFNRR
ncbi:cytochrome P450 [Phascolomyces articulosus]|uniref:Cytochrome P450 n=1 Tax=Phascolomyces articulosus TaxID=60185 RepID=A0AAD5PBJ2_9FUNG|nr:cytochrome P450 [Phascolomyces articulosus]